MAPLDPLFEYEVHPTRASLEAPLGRSSTGLESLAAACDDGSAYISGNLIIRNKPRRISVPRPQLDSVQRRISQILYPIDLLFGPAPHGYVAGRSTLTNATPHTGARFLQKFDMKDFFSNINTARIQSTLCGLGFGGEAAALLARLTSCEGSLPLGARTSPRISNMVLVGIDDHLQTIASENSLAYTRYADDITFSSHKAFDVRAPVESVVAAAGFELNESKTRSFKHGQPMFVTGLSVEDADRPRVRKRLKARLRQEFYYIEKFGLFDHASARGESATAIVSRLTGEYHYCRTVEPNFVEALARQFPTAVATVVPIHQDTRSERAQRYRQNFLAEVDHAPGGSLPFYVPGVALREK